MVRTQGGPGTLAKSNHNTDISLETFSRVVEAIYDCALDPNRWHQTVRQIASLSESQVCMLGVHDYTNGHSELSFKLGYDDPHWIRLHEETYKGMNPFWASLQLVPVGVVTTRAMLVDDAEFLESRFYREWCKPQQLDDMINFKVLKTEHRIGWLAAHRLDSYPRYGKSEVQLWTLLAPHVCRAVAISDALSLKTIRSEALEATLDVLASGVYLVDRLGRIVFMNRAAEQQVRAGAAVRIENDHLVPVDPMAREAMSRALAEAIADEASAAVAGVSLALPGAGSSLVATVLPLTRGERHNVCGAFSAMAAVFVQDPVVVPPFPGEAFAELYGLTGGELRVLLALAPGLSVKEAAEVLGISETTAKTHLQHIYAKTGTSKQAELMQLFARSAPPVKVS